MFIDGIRAIKLTLDMHGIPITDAEKMRVLADGFAYSGNAPNQLYGCFGALDGTAIEITNPDDRFVPRYFFCSKWMYGLAIQAVIHSKLRLMYMSGMCCV